MLRMRSAHTSSSLADVHLQLRKLFAVNAIESISKINLQQHCVVAVTLNERTCCLCTQSNTKTQLVGSQEIATCFSTSSDSNLGDKMPEGIANGNRTNTSIFLSESTERCTEED